MKLVKQTAEEDSAAACLATIFGMPDTKQIEVKLGRPVAYGVPTEEVIELLNSYGYSYSIRYAQIGDAPTCLPTPAEAMHDAHIEKRGTWLVRVPSLNGEVWGHWVIVTRTNILDPATKVQYIGEDTSLEPYEVIKLERPQYD